MNVILLATVSLPVSFLSRLPIGAEDVQIKTLVTAWVKDDTREGR